MAGKKVPSVEESLEQLKDVLQRCSLLSDYYYVNRNMVSITKDEVSVYINVEPVLWEAMANDKEISSKMKEIDINDEQQKIMQNNLMYLDTINDQAWFDIANEQLYDGKIISIQVNGRSYEIPIQKAMIPIKLKKAEFNLISYRVFENPDVLAIKKKFVGCVPDTSFTIMRLFKIL